MWNDIWVFVILDPHEGEYFYPLRICQDNCSRVCDYSFVTRNFFFVFVCVNNYVLSSQLVLGLGGCFFLVLVICAPA